ncbi:hypothetical protein LguiB_009007 [Lonicera macranthoides]
MVNPPHVLLLPYPGQGHVLPMMELAQVLAKHGFKLTFVNTENTQERMRNGSSKDASLGNQIRFVSISDGIGPGESRKVPEEAFRSLYQVLPGKFEELMVEINKSEDEKITCLIADNNFGWALEIAAKMGIKRAAFLPAAAALMVVALNIPKLIEDGLVDENGGSYIREGVKHDFCHGEVKHDFWTPMKNRMLQLSPDMLTVNTSHFGWACVGNFTMQKLIFEVMVKNNASIKLAEWLICNSIYDLEPGAFNLAPQIVPIGPLLASNRLGNSEGNFWQEDSSCLTWLDQQPDRSVLYVAFGSTTILNKTQFEELALGIELTNRPFLWVVRPGIKSTNGANDAYPEGFLERVSLRGKIVSWAPQQKVLSHPSVACFMSHCGWNSTIEGVSNGVPFLCWPYFADQFTNETYICEVWKVGLGFKKDSKGIIGQSQIKDKVERLLGNQEFAERAFDLKGKITSSIKEGGSSNKNLSNFIEWIKAGKC